MNRQNSLLPERLRRVCASLVLLLVMGISLPAAERPRSPSGGSPASTNKVLRLAVGDFASEVDRPESIERSRRLTELLHVQLSSTPWFELVERREIEAVANEVTISLSQPAKSSTAVRVGKMLRADWFIGGTFLSFAGTNCVVARVVDAQTGLVRDMACLLNADNDPVALSRAVADFAVNSQRNVASLKQRVFLGVGGFEDVGVNNRHPELRKSIRLHLEEMFRGTSVAVVERTMVSPLLEELRLNRIGLTTPAAVDHTALPGFFLVDGTYQSRFEGGEKVELILKVTGFGKGAKSFQFKAVDTELVKQVAVTVRDIVTKSEKPATATATDEALIQLERGKDRSRLPWSMEGITLGGYPLGENDTKRRQNIVEAIEAFEAALFLDPELHEAKLYLARCLLDPQIGITNKARDFLREVIAGSTNSTLAWTAHHKHAESYLNEDDARALKMYSKMLTLARNPGERARLLESMYMPMERLHRNGQVGMEEGFAHLKKLLWTFCEAAQWAGTNYATNSSSDIPQEMDGLTGRIQNTFTCFGRYDDFNTRTGQEHLDVIVPSLCDSYPEWAPNILVTYVVWQAWDPALRPSKVIIARLAQALESSVRNPERVILLKQLRQMYFSQLSKWCQTNNQPAMLACVEKLWLHGHTVDPRIFSRTNAPTRTLFPHLGLKEVAQFSIGAPLLTLPEPTTFACDGGRIWLRDGFLPAEYDIATGQLTDLRWPRNVSSYITCIAVGKESVWFGTAGSGLLELSKQTRRWRQYLERDGLIFPKISALHHTAEGLWIGFGHLDTGGVGFLDFKTGRITAFTPALNPQAAHPALPSRTSSPGAEPPKNRVVAFAQTSLGDLWMAVTTVGLQRYQIARNEWSTTGLSLGPFRSENVRCFVASRQRLVLGGGGGVTVHDLESGQTQGIYLLFHYVKYLTGKPSLKNQFVHSLALDGDKVWIGGVNYLALADIMTGSIDRIAQFGDSEVVVRCLQLHGDDLWLAVENELFRVPKSVWSARLTSN